MIKGLATAGALVAYNTVTNIWHHTDRTYLLRNAAAAVALLVLARHSGLSWSDLGLGRSDLQSGWRWGGMTAGGIAAAAGLGVLALRHRHVGRRMLADRRADLTDRELAWQALVRIPVGTAAFEELAFRGVLFALLHRAGGTPLALAGSSVAFGLWHIGPTLAALRQNGISTRRAVPVSAAVAATTAAGLGFGLLRRLSGHVVACWLVHWASNAVTLASAARWQRSNGTTAPSPEPPVAVATA